MVTRGQHVLIQAKRRAKFRVPQSIDYTGKVYIIYAQSQRPLNFLSMRLLIKYYMRALH